jgi:hypothetical protein
VIYMCYNAKISDVLHSPAKIRQFRLSKEGENIEPKNTDLSKIEK